MTAIKILSVNLCPETGKKFPVNELVLNEKGAIGDANYGDATRPIVIMDKESMDETCNILGIENVSFGESGENISVCGLKKEDINPLDRLLIGGSTLEITGKGKPQYIKSRQDLALSQHGVFARVITPGNLKAGDEIVLSPKIFKVRIIVLSDRAFAGSYTDRSGVKIKEMTELFFAKMKRGFQIDYALLPDDMQMLSKELNESVFEDYDVLLTSGGTGIGPRDITVETIRPLLTKEIPGIMESIRIQSGMAKPSALLSCGIAGVIGKTLLFTLPGSLRAVEEYLTEIFKVLDHAIYTIHGIDLH